MSCQKSELYVCGQEEGKCSCIAEMLRNCASECELSCCGKPMAKAVLKTADQGKEKHVPVIEKIDGGFKVKIGEVPHPMEEDHFIEFIEIQAGDEVMRKYLKPGAAPEAVFKTDAASVQAIEFCNKHGLWKA